VCRPVELPAVYRAALTVEVGLRQQHNERACACGTCDVPVCRRRVARLLRWKKVWTAQFMPSRFERVKPTEGPGEDLYDPQA
jgi:hypothetical protein